MNGKEQNTAQRTLMYVVKRNGARQLVRFDKVTERIRRMCRMKPELDESIVDPPIVAQKVIRGIFCGVKTTQLDLLAAETAAYCATQHPQYGKLAARLLVSNLHKETSGDICKVFDVLRSNVNVITGEPAPLVGIVPFQFVQRHADALRAAMHYNRDYRYDYFGYKTLERSYLMRSADRKIVERPQDMLMRVAIGIHHPTLFESNISIKPCPTWLNPSKLCLDFYGERGDEQQALHDIIETYDMLSRGLFIHATPTLFNAATPRPQMSSCFLVPMSEDSIDGIYSTLKQCALISKGGGGIGISITSVRATDAYIRGTNGRSNGIVPMLRVYNDTARYVDQCFAPQTLIYTEDGPCAISKLNVGVKVMTASGNFQSVERVLEHTYSGPLLKVNGFLVTPQHQILVRKRVGVVEKMIDADEMRIGDSLCYPVNNDGGMKYVRIDTLALEQVTDAKVYDLEVAVEHTYVTEMGAVHNGGGKRKGAFAVYIEPWHADIEDFLQLKKNHGKEERRARDLFYGLWVPDLFMRRVEENGKWSLFSPDAVPGLITSHGKEFETLYECYEREGKARRVVNAQDLWRQIIESQIETGTPYMMYKDACNSKSNQQNLGTIQGGNLCCEVVEYTSKDEVAVCNLASLALPKFVNVKEQTYNHKALARVVRVAVRNLNKVIDKNHYPIPEARTSNMRHRPIGIGVQGLADVFLLLRMPFDSERARKLNREIFETIYYAALDESCRLAHKCGRSYESFNGSPLSRGLLQFDLWNEKPESEREGAVQRYDWQELRLRVVMYGVINSLLVAPMPTASTSQILGNCECIEPYTSNVYTRRVLAGEFPVVNAHLVRDLQAIGLWTAEVRNEVVRNKGSVQSIKDIPDDLKKLYRTVWEVPQRALIDMSADRGIYVCQSQSFNVSMANPTFSKLTSMHFYGWKKGLKTGMYYLRTKAASDAIQFTVSRKKKEKSADDDAAIEQSSSSEHCSMLDGCLSCGS